MRIAVAAIASLVLVLPAAAQSASKTCPEPLASAQRLVVVVADNFTASTATVHRFEKSGGQWRAVGGPVSALIGLKGMAWSQSFRALAGRGEPVKYEGDKRVPAGIYAIGRSFGFGASPRKNYLRLVEGTVCVDDPMSPAYNTITTRQAAGPRAKGENMWRVPEYRHGLTVDYPTDALAKAGSCIFIHVALPGKKGTAGCVALPEPDVLALQEFAEPGAVLAVLPRAALPRLTCLPPLP